MCVVRFVYPAAALFWLLLLQVNTVAVAEHLAADRLYASVQHQHHERAPVFLYTPSGGVPVHSALVRDHVPTAPQGVLQSLLFERVTDNLLVSRHLNINVKQVAPHVHVPDVSNTRVVVDRVRRATAPRGPTMRFGENHTFVYDYQSNALLTAWGPGLHLRPLHPELHPNVFVNLRHGASLKKLHLEHVPSSSSIATSRHPRVAPFTYRGHNAHLQDNRVRHSGRSKRASSAGAEELLQWRAAQLNYRPNFTTESEIFFDVAFAFDAPFCKRFGTPDNVSQVVHAAAVAAHKMALGPIVSVRIGDIIGACDETKDDFQRPASVLNCPAASRTCSRPGLTLDAFRKAWPGGGIADATYLLSGIEEGSDVVGAAWIAAACNPEFSFGWIEGDYPVIIAHEISHSLGAQHSETGLMRPALDLDKPAYLAPGSLAQIQTYLQKIAPLNCMLPRHGSTSQNRRRYSAFTRLTLSNITVGTDVAIMPTNDVRVVIVIMLDARYTKAYGDYLSFSFANVRRNPNNKAFPFTVINEVEPVLFYAKNISFTHPAGGGLAIAKIIDKVSYDAVVVYLQGGYFKYVVGHKINQAKGILGSWLMVPRVPINAGPSVQCFGATISSLGGASASVTNDMVIAYVDKRGETSRAYYIVGLDIGTDGSARQWMPPQVLDWNTTNEIGDIGVDMIDTTKSGRPDLVFSYTERINGLWAHRITLGYDVDTMGRPTKTWKSITPDLTYSSTSEVEKITGGIALVNMGSSRPTALIYQGREINTGNTQWLEIGDDILAEEPGDAPPSIAVVDGITPLETCRDCYSPDTGLPQCEERIRECFATKTAPDISALTSKRQLTISDTSTQLSQPIVRMGLIPKPSVPTIFCAGFHELFLSLNAGCRSDVQNVNVVTAGAASAFQEDLANVEVSSNAKDALSEVAFNTSYGKIPEHLNYLSPGGTSGNTLVPKTVQVYFQSENASRGAIINKAIAKFKKRKDFYQLFSGATYKVEQRGKYLYTVIINFNNKYLKSFLKKLTASS